MIDWKKKSFVPFEIKKANESNQSEHSCINDFGVYRVIFKDGTVKDSVCPGMLLEELKSFSKNAPKLLELPVGDLLLDPASCSGVYIFSDDSKILYIGKCTSKPFIERIGSHLTPRRGDFFNRFVKAIYKKLFESGMLRGKAFDEQMDIDNIMTPEVLNVLQKMRVTFIPFLMETYKKEEKIHIGKFERSLIKTLDPLYQTWGSKLCNNCNIVSDACKK